MAEIVNSTNTRKTGGKPGQWKLVAVLTAVLVLLVATSGGSKDTEESAELSPVSSTGPVTPDASSVSSSQREIHWPEVPLEFLLTHNPFRPGAARSLASTSDPVIPADSATEGDDVVAPAGESETSTAESGLPIPFAKDASLLAAKKVQMIFRSARGAAAMIDDKVYHEGDQISDYVITSIARHGVTLRPAGDVKPASAGTDSGL